LIFGLKSIDKDDKIMFKDNVISSEANCPLFNSFTFVKGIGVKTEITLRELGIHSWNDVVKKQCPELFPKQKWYTILKSVNSAKDALKNLDVFQLTHPLSCIFKEKILLISLESYAFLIKEFDFKLIKTNVIQKT